MFTTCRFLARPAVAATVATSLCIATTTTRADDLSDLRRDLAALRERVTALQETSPAPPDASAVVTAGATPGSLRLPGSDTSVTFGGYLKLDAIYSDRSAGTASQGNQFLSPTLIPIGPTAGDNARSQTTFHARQSRLFVRTATPTSLGDLTTYVEGDFFGADGNETVSNSNGFRVRHAWGTLGPFSAGQYWSNFMNEAALPETLDFGGPVGQIFVRQAQVRWTARSTAGEWSVALENPESLFGVPGTPTLLRADRDRWPDLTAKFKTTLGRGIFGIQAMARDIRIDSSAPLATTDSRWGGALAVSGVIPTGTGKGDLRFDLNAGNAIGRYQELGYYADGYVGDDHRIRLAPTVSGYVAYRHFWTARLRSSLVIAASRADNPPIAFGGVNRSARSEHLNLIWNPVNAVNLGVELINARRVVDDGRSGRLNRVQLSAQYGF